MRENLPVTGQEFPVEPDATLMSTTDTASKIRYVNSAFVSISGFSEREFLDQPHNIVRHPDMPVEAFADMWATLKSGRPWTGLVQKRRKNGDHYWVRANAAPVVHDGRTQGYCPLVLARAGLWRSGLDHDVIARRVLPAQAWSPRGNVAHKGLKAAMGWR